MHALRKLCACLPALKQISCFTQGLNLILLISSYNLSICLCICFYAPHSLHDGVSFFIVALVLRLFPFIHFYVEFHIYSIFLCCIFFDHNIDMSIGINPEGVCNFFFYQDYALDLNMQLICRHLS